MIPDIRVREGVVRPGSNEIRLEVGIQRLLPAKNYQRSCESGLLQQYSHMPLPYRLINQTMFVKSIRVPRRNSCISFCRWGLPNPTLRFIRYDLQSLLALV